MGNQKNKRQPVARAAKAADMPVSGSMRPTGLRPKPKPHCRLLESSADSESEKPVKVDTLKVSKPVKAIKSDRLMSSLMPEGGSAAVPNEESDSDDKREDEESEEDKDEDEDEDDAECACHLFL